MYFIPTKMKNTMIKRKLSICLFFVLLSQCFSPKSTTKAFPDILNSNPIIGKWCNTEGAGWYTFEKNGIFKSGSHIDPSITEGTWIKPQNSDSVKYEYSLNNESYKFSAFYTFFGDTLRMYVYSVNYDGYMWLYLKKCSN